MGAASPKGEGKVPPLAFRRRGHQQTNKKARMFGCIKKPNRSRLGLGTQLGLDRLKRA